MLYERGYEKQDIIELFRFIDWVMVLPEDLSRQFINKIYQYEEDQHMPYVTTVEKRGIEKGIQQGIQQGVQQGIILNAKEVIIEALELRFGKIPPPITEKINEINDPSKLRDLHKKAIQAANYEDFGNIC